MDHKSSGESQYVGPRVTSAKLPARTGTLQNALEQRKLWHLLTYIAGVMSVVLLRFEHRKAFLLASSAGYLFVA